MKNPARHGKPICGSRAASALNGQWQRDARRRTQRAVAQAAPVLPALGSIGRRRLWVESLEQRCLLSSYDLNTVLTTYDTAAAKLASAQQDVALANQALGTNISIPLIAQTLSSALGLSTDLQTPFQTALAGSSWSSVVSALPSGFSVVTAFHRHTRR